MLQSNRKVGQMTDNNFCTEEGTFLIPISKLQKKLDARWEGAVSAHEADGVLTLSGYLPTWSEVVAAGQMCADKKSRRMLVNDIACGEAQPAMRAPQKSDDALEGAAPDVLIVGAGVVGCAIARELTRKKLNVLLVDKEHDVALGASSRNDGMVHPGIDLHPWQKKQKYCLRGNAMFAQVCRDLQVSYRQTGQLLGFRQKWARPFLHIAPLYWRVLGIPCYYASQKQLHETEPEIAADIACALRFPTAGIVCPYGLTIAYAENAVQNGARISLDTAVLGMECAAGRITAVHTNRGTLHPRVVVNAAGVFSDEIARMADDRFYSVHPRRGTNAILDKKAAHQVRTIASLLGTVAVESSHSKGGGLVSTVDGNLLVGPDAVETPERENYATSAQSVRATFKKQRQTSPQLTERDIITYFTGVRAATYEEDFVVEKGRRTRNLVHVAGIQSPGLTAAPALGVDAAEMAEDLLRAQGIPILLNPTFEPSRKAIPHTASLPDAARDALIRDEPNFGIIVCRCEEVSRGEIKAALHRPVPCDTVDGVKRRVRPGMGRCQGGFCGPLVTAIIAEELGVAPETVKKSGEGSELNTTRTKGGSAQ